MSEEKPRGRPSDDAVGWFLHWRLHELIDTEKRFTQAELADAANVPRSAVSNIYKRAMGAGPATAQALAKFLGFATRGAMTDAADAWYDGPGRDYVIDWYQGAATRRAGSSRRRKTA